MKTQIEKKGNTIISKVIDMTNLESGRKTMKQATTYMVTIVNVATDTIYSFHNHHQTFDTLAEARAYVKGRELHEQMTKSK